jgi:hypothetical protein
MWPNYFWPIAMNSTSNGNHPSRCPFFLPWLGSRDITARGQLKFPTQRQMTIFCRLSLSFIQLFCHLSYSSVVCSNWICRRKTNDTFQTTNYIPTTNKDLSFRDRNSRMAGPIELSSKNEIIRESRSRGTIYIYWMLKIGSSRTELHVIQNLHFLGS